jgi:serine/threonine protein kinase
MINQNVLQVCLTDFGFAIRVSDLNLDTNRCGTPGYCAPEIFKKANFSEKSDIFSLGCIFYNMLTANNLFRGNDISEITTSNKY